MKTYYLTVFWLILLSASPLLSQNRSNWDLIYKETTIGAVIGEENRYADSIDKTPGHDKYYTRIDRYRLHAAYTGEVRVMSEEKLGSLKRVLEAYKVNTKIIQDVKYEMLFLDGDMQVWMPVRTSLIKQMQKEKKKKQDTGLYCLFANEHTSGGKLYNHFLISEFK